jgi:hypothetical protein
MITLFRSGNGIVHMTTAHEIDGFTVFRGSDRHVFVEAAESHGYDFLDDGERVVRLHLIFGFATEEDADRDADGARKAAETFLRRERYSRVDACRNPPLASRRAASRWCEALRSESKAPMDMQNEWLPALCSWAESNESVHELWLFGSRAKGCSRLTVMLILLSFSRRREASTIGRPETISTFTASGSGNWKKSLDATLALKP